MLAPRVGEDPVELGPQPRHLGGGEVAVANRMTGLVLDGRGNVGSGSVTKQWTYDGSTNLLWTVTAV